MLGFRKSFVGSLPALIKGESTMIVGVHLVNHRKDRKEDTSYPSIEGNVALSSKGFETSAEKAWRKLFTWACISGIGQEGAQPHWSTVVIHRVLSMLLP
jgi:hypothetical protein